MLIEFNDDTINNHYLCCFLLLLLEIGYIVLMGVDHYGWDGGWRLSNFHFFSVMP